MIKRESRFETHLELLNLNKTKYHFGFFLSIHDLMKLTRDFQADCHDGFVSNDQSYIENWLKNHTRIEDEHTDENYNKIFKKMDEQINKTTETPPEGFDYFSNGE